MEQGQTWEEKFENFTKHGDLHSRRCEDGLCSCIQSIHDLITQTIASEKSKLIEEIKVAFAKERDSRQEHNEPDEVDITIDCLVERLPFLQDTKL